MAAPVVDHIAPAAVFAWKAITSVECVVRPCTTLVTPFIPGPTIVAPLASGPAIVVPLISGSAIFSLRAMRRPRFIASTVPIVFPLRLIGTIVPGAVSAILGEREG